MAPATSGNIYQVCSELLLTCMHVSAGSEFNSATHDFNRQLATPPESPSFDRTGSARNLSPPEGFTLQRRSPSGRFALGGGAQSGSTTELRRMSHDSFQGLGYPSDGGSLHSEGFNEAGMLRLMRGMSLSTPMNTTQLNMQSRANSYESAQGRLAGFNSCGDLTTPFGMPIKRTDSWSEAIGMSPSGHPTAMGPSAGPAMATPFSSFGGGGGYQMRSQASMTNGNNMMAFNIQAPNTPPPPPPPPPGSHNLQNGSPSHSGQVCHRSKTGVRTRLLFCYFLVTFCYGVCCIHECVLLIDQLCVL